MSRDPHYYSRDLRDSRDRRDPRDIRHHIRDERDYRNYDKPRKRTPSREDNRRSRSPKKDLLDDNILREIAKLPEPSEMWAPHNSGAPPPPGTGFAEALPSYSQNYQPTYSGLYDDFPSMPGPPQPPEWTQMQLQPPPLPTPPSIAPPPPAIEPRAPTFEDQVKKEAAIESEMRHQKAALSKQREDYMKKAGILKKELDTLKDQRNELRGDPKRSPSPDTKRFLKENTKLQLEIQNKLKTITNVVDMLNGIIGENAQELKIDSDGDSNEKTTKRRSRSPSNKFNYVYYDPEMHWCRVCNEFPPTAKDYLNHLHSPQHHKMAAAHMEAPWHSLPPQNEGFPSYPSAPTKRTPIRGLQFFVPSTAWYCKLCDQFIGDLHCASAHLKSITHSKNYHNFVEQNPHWETDWMSDRQKAVEKSRAKPKMEERPPPPPPPQPPAPAMPPQYSAHTITFHKDGSYTKRKDSPPIVPVDEDKKKKDKKKKGKKRKKSSSSSSDSDSSSSGSETNKKKKKKKTAKEEEDDGRLLNEWMSSLHSGRLSSSERRLMDSLKQRMKQEANRPGHRETPDGRGRSREREAERRRLEDRRRNEEARGNENSRGKEDKRRNEERRRDDERHERRDQQRRDRSPEKSKPKKMPFIGKMPVYKSLSKARAEEQKKDDTKKQEDDQKDKKRREEIDAEIQKKVAEFKEKIAKAQEEREKLSAEPIMIPIPPPGVAIPQRATSILGPPPVVVPPPPSAMPNLPKDFQEALDIIFPTENKAEMQEGLFPAIPGIGGFPFNPFQGMGIMPQMPPQMPQMPPQMGQMPPQMPQLPPNMPPMQQPPMQPHGMGFGMNQQMFPRFDNFQQNNNANNNRQQNKTKNSNNYKQYNNNSGSKKVNGSKKAKEDQAKKEADAKKSVAAKKKIEELDDLAMLGIDASDVGSGL